jgi:transposase
MSGNNIKVVCRFRPQNKLEIREGGYPIIEISEDGTGVSLKVTTGYQVPEDRVKTPSFANVGKRYKFIFIR